MLKNRDFQIKTLICRVVINPKRPPLDSFTGIEEIPRFRRDRNTSATASFSLHMIIGVVPLSDVDSREVSGEG